MKFLVNAEKYCGENGHRFTESREKVLALLADAKTPMGAYDIIAQMPKGTKPPTVYRALEFWQGEGFIHKIESMNAYAVCRVSGDHGAGGCHHGAQFLICQDCREVKEIHACHLPGPLEKQALAAGFRPNLWSVEIRGLCSSCQ